MYKIYISILTNMNGKQKTECKTSLLKASFAFEQACWE